MLTGKIIDSGVDSSDEWQLHHGRFHCVLFWLPEKGHLWDLEASSSSLLFIELNWTIVSRSENGFKYTDVMNKMFQV